VPRALAVTVDGPPAWLLLDRYGRAVGAPPGGGPWLDQLPAARGPLPRPEGAGVLVPDPEGEYQLILWAGEAPRDYRVAAWPTQGQALFGGTPPREPPAAARFEGRVATGSATVLGFTLQERAVVAVRPAQVADELPTMLRVAFALAAPPGAAAQSYPPATSYSIDAEAPPPTEVSGAPSGVSGDGSATGAPAPAPAGGNAPAASAGAPAQPLSGAAARSAPSSAAAQPAVRDLTSRSGVDASAANPPENQAADAAAPSPAPEVSSFSRSFVMGMPTALPPTQPPSQLPGGAASTFSSAVPPSPIAPPSAADRSPVPTVAAQPQARVPPTPGSAGPGGPAAVSQPTGASVGSAAGLGTLAENASGDLPVAPSLSGTAGPLPPPLGRRGAGATAGRVSATATASPARLLPGGADRATTPVPGSATAGTTPGVRTH